MSAANWGILGRGGGVNIFFSGPKRPPSYFNLRKLFEFHEATFETPPRIHCKIS